ncbi:hypothetical protein DFS33DRAFT_24443 [Desarmillaria ectypa]|nr:hypothetical protein DFS33DRAFT_24443 [Desarmillaria ectypa]
MHVIPHLTCPILLLQICLLQCKRLITNTRATSHTCIPWSRLHLSDEATFLLFLLVPLPLLHSLSMASTDDEKVVVETLTAYLNGLALEALVHGMYTSLVGVTLWYICTT